MLVLWRILLIAARANQKSGNFLQAKDFFLKSEETLAGLSQAWGKEAFEGYIRRPDIVGNVKLLNDEVRKFRN